ncbi:MAG: alpha/beta fold hydrolase [Nitriliruptorales bacterium]
MTRRHHRRASPSVVALLHSPLLAPLVWEAVAELLNAQGRTVVVPDLNLVTPTDPPYLPRLASAAADAIDSAGRDAPAVLVGHSMAGMLIPAVMEELSRPVIGAVLVDSHLPTPGASWWDNAPPQLARQLQDLAVVGRLPPWHQWFPDDVVAGMLPDLRLARRFLAQLQPVPLALFKEPFPGRPSWADETTCAYVLLSGPYREVARQAADRGWLVTQLDEHHLAMLTEPDAVAATLQALLADMDL